MLIRNVFGNEAGYTLIAFDEDGIERAEPDKVLASERLTLRVSGAEQPISDVFFMSHGWQADVPSAIAQYDTWVKTWLQADPASGRQPREGFSPLVVGLHWPSLPWGVETIGPGGGALLSARGAGEAPIDSQVDQYASRIADTPVARTAIRSILEAARRDSKATKLSPAMRALYATLFAESGLESGDATGRPGADQEGFDPVAIVAEAIAGGEQAPGGDPGVLGLGDTVFDVLVAPLRQLSFWKMKDRARRFGESGAHDLLARLQTAAGPNARYHLMGHSFGCIVVSAMVAGRANGPPPRAVDSLFLVQGALSLWSYADKVPYARGQAGYFNPIVKRGLVRGPIVTTRSAHDTAVGRFYPMGAQLAQQKVLGQKFPAYGAIGAFGIQGVAGVEDRPMQSTTYAYGFRERHIYNLEASGIIKNGSGLSGAHSDIAHPEVAHAFWAAITAGLSGPVAVVDDTRLWSEAGVGTSAPGAAPLLGGRGHPLVLEAMEWAGLGSPPPAYGSTPYAAAPADESVPKAGAASPSPRTQFEAFVQGRPDPAAAAPGRPAVTIGGGPGLLGGQAELHPMAPEGAAGLPSPGAAGVGAPPQPPPGSSAQRWIHAAVEDLEADAALAVSQWYALAFDVDVVQRSTAAATALLSPVQFPANADEVKLTVQLESADFDIPEARRMLSLPRVGKSRKARFDISPLHDGPSRLKATIHKEGNFIQQMELTFEVGASHATAVQVTTRGRAPSAVEVVKPRDFGLVIWPIAGGYECQAFGPVSKLARLPILPAALEKAIDVARQEIMSVVMQRTTDGEYVFQTRIDIPASDSDVALRTLARAGSQLFRKLFFGPGAAEDSKKVGEFLKKMVSDRTKRVKLQIVAETVPVPWGLLYVGDASAKARLDWNHFIGMRHVIEQIPLQNTDGVFDSTIPSDRPRLAVGVNLNDEIDAKWKVDFVARQRTYWQNAVASRQRVNVTARTTRAEVMTALASRNTEDQILYFYCHAEAASLAAAGGPGDSCLVLSDDRLRLEDLNLDAPTTTRLSGSPLVFINACESAQMSPAFYDGFVPYFMAKGARGVVGTECQTPGLFAAEWARRFFERFLDGESLGETFLHLRQEFLKKHNNPLGLLYAVHCDGDTQIDPAVSHVA